MNITRKHSTGTTPRTLLMIVAQGLAMMLIAGCSGKQAPEESLYVDAPPVTEESYANFCELLRGGTPTTPEQILLLEDREIKLTEVYGEDGVYLVGCGLLKTESEVERRPREHDFFDNLVVTNMHVPAHIQRAVEEDAFGLAKRSKSRTHHAAHIITAINGGLRVNSIHPDEALQSPALGLDNMDTVFIGIELEETLRRWFPTQNFEMDFESSCAHPAEVFVSANDFADCFMRKFPILKEAQ